MWQDRCSLSQPALPSLPPPGRETCKQYLSQYLGSEQILSKPHNHFSQQNRIWAVKGCHHCSCPIKDHLIYIIGSFITCAILSYINSHVTTLGHFPSLLVDFKNLKSTSLTMCTIIHLDSRLSTGHIAYIANIPMIISNAAAKQPEAMKSHVGVQLWRKSCRAWDSLNFSVNTFTWTVSAQAEAKVRIWWSWQPALEPSFPICSSSWGSLWWRWWWWWWWWWWCWWSCQYFSLADCFPFCSPSPWQGWLPSQCRVRPSQCTPPEVWDDPEV